MNTYDYEREKHRVTTYEGVIRTATILIKAINICKHAGVCTKGVLVGSGDSWDSMASIDFLIEARKLVQVVQGERWQDSIVRIAE